MVQGEGDGHGLHVQLVGVEDALQLVRWREGGRGDGPNVPQTSLEGSLSYERICPKRLSNPQRRLAKPAPPNNKQKAQQKKKKAGRIQKKKPCLPARYRIPGCWFWQTNVGRFSEKEMLQKREKNFGAIETISIISAKISLTDFELVQNTSYGGIQCFGSPQWQCLVSEI